MCGESCMKRREQAKKRDLCKKSDVQGHLTLFRHGPKGWTEKKATEQALSGWRIGNCACFLKSHRVQKESRSPHPPSPGFACSTFHINLMGAAFPERSLCRTCAGGRDKETLAFVHLYAKKHSGRLTSRDISFVVMSS